MKRLLLLATILAIPCFAQSSTVATAVVPATPFVNQLVGAGVGYSQQSSPQDIFGGVVYAKLLSAAAGTYSYTSITDTSVSIKPKFSVQTTTQTGGCVYTTKFGGWNVFTCAQVGIALASGTTGVGATGTIIAQKPIGAKGWQLLLAGGPAYSGAAGGGVSYPIGVIVGWGK